MPTIPSTTTSGRRPGSVTTRPPARSSAARPCGVGLVGEQPRLDLRAAPGQHRPGPQRVAAVVARPDQQQHPPPVRRAEEVDHRGGQPVRRPLHQRPLGQPRHQLGLRRPDLLDGVRVQHAATLAAGPTTCRRRRSRGCRRSPSRTSPCRHSRAGPPPAPNDGIGSTGPADVRGARRVGLAARRSGDRSARDAEVSVAGRARQRPSGAIDASVAISRWQTESRVAVRMSAGRSASGSAGALPSSSARTAPPRLTTIGVTDGPVSRGPVAPAALIRRWVEVARAWWTTSGSDSTLPHVRASTRPPSAPPAPPTAERDAGVVRQREVHRGTPRGRRRGPARCRAARTAAGPSDSETTSASCQCMSPGAPSALASASLAANRAASEASGPLELDGREQSLRKPGRAGQRQPEPLDVDHVDADADHGHQELTRR